MVFLFVSCNIGTNKENIIGNWRIVNFDANVKDISPILINAGRREALSTTYIFNKDSTFIMKSASFIEGQQGRWSIDAKNKTILFDFDNDKMDNDTYTLEELNQFNMLWSQKLDQGFGTITMILEKE